MKHSTPVFSALRIILLAVGAGLFGWSCTSAAKHSTFPCFYFWKTELRFDSLAWQRLSHMSGQQPLFVRFFDVDYLAQHGDAIPVSDLQIRSSTDGRPLVPTVYITNRVFLQITDNQLNNLAKKVYERIANRLGGWQNGAENCQELQIDCDWTATTRDRYFQFLRAFRTLAAPRRVSCTIRLHQFRDRDKTGIPPVDRGMLMCYNVADPKNPVTANAILDLPLVRGYLKAPPYPMTLDVALPIFSWGAWFRGADFQGLIAGLDSVNIYKSNIYVEEMPGRYRITKDTVIGADFLRAGDWIRLDQPAEADLLALTDLLRTGIRRGDTRLVFFDWQSEKMNRYEKIVAACAAHFQ